LRDLGVVIRNNVETDMKYVNIWSSSGRTGPGVDSASNRNEYQESLYIYIYKRGEIWGVKCGRRVGLTTLPPSISRLSK
jgi:hypothetical protein